MNTDELNWTRSTPRELPGSNEVHVWRVFLDTTTCRHESLREILSADELARASRFRFEIDQNRFIAARGMLRQILGSYLGIEPYKLQFDYTSYGKPALASNEGHVTIRFNLSHSNGFALYGITRGRNIGIDIELVRDDIAAGPIAQRFFSKSEISSLERIHKNKRSGVFFQYWTRKEAFLKAKGEGISFPMEQCDVSLINGKVLSPVTFLGDQSEKSCWYGQDLFPGHGYAAAIVVEGSDWELSCWDYAV
jgi:4'-phosphopantetheinyl transferase